MRFDAEQRFDVPVDRILALFTDPDFYETLKGLPDISQPSVVHHSVSGDTIRIDLHQRYTGDLPAAALAVIDPARLTWVEQLVFDLAAATASTRLVPDHYPDRLSCTGTYVFRARASGGSIRRLDGELKVRVPLVGGRVEQALVNGLRDHASAEQDMIGERLAAEPPGTSPDHGPKHKGKGKAKPKGKAGPQDKTKGAAKAKSKSKKG